MRIEGFSAPRIPVLEGMSEGFASIDRDFRFQYVNAAAERIINIKRQDLLGCDLWDAFPAARGTAIETEYRTAMTARSAARFEYFYPPALAWFEVNIDPTEDGGLSLYFHDVTHRKRNETILDGQRRALELAVSGAPLAETLTLLARTIEDQSSLGVIASILLLDDDGMHLRHGAAPHLPQSYIEAIDGAAIGPLAGSCGTAAYTRERVIVNDIETDPRWEQYRHFAVPAGLRACWSTPIMSVQGAVLGTFAVYHRQKAFMPTASDLEVIDLLTHTASVVIERARESEKRRDAEAKLKIAKEEAERANGAKDQFLAMLAHELRNPLAPIVTALELADMRGDDPTGERAVIERQVGHLVRLVEDLLDMARFTRGKVELKRERLHMRDVVTTALEMARRVIEEKGHRVEVEIASVGVDVDGDPVRLAQIASNLIANAAKYTTPGGSISVKVEREGDQVVLRVRDNGIGLTPEMQTRVFDAFVQDSAALNEARGGLGLGLAIVRTLVELHGGTVEARSEGRDQGSEFIVRLPAGVERRENQIAALRDIIPAAAGDTRVLIVDDNEDAAALLGTTLRRMGYTVAVAHDGVTGLQAAAEFRPNVALLDIGLPYVNGYDLGRQIRALDGLENVRLVAATGSAQLSDEARSAKAGFDAHLVKPISIRTLSHTLDSLKQH
jgi:signal transduction histidine kinase